MASQRGRRLRLPAAATEDLKFVNISHPGDIRRCKRTQTEIRRHVMRDSTKQRRRRSPNEVETGYGPDWPTLRPTPHGPHHDESFLFHMQDPSRGSLTRSLAPLGSFPIPADGRVLELVRFFNEGTDIYVPFRSIWFEISLSDTGTFHVTLGNAAAQLETLHENKHPTNSLEVRKHYSQSLMDLRKRLSSVVEGTKAGTIANILAHVCLSLRLGDWHSLQVHMDGLSLVWKARGGFADLSDQLNITIFQFDLAVAMVLDCVPRFPLPPHVPPSEEGIRDMPQRLQALLIRLARPLFAPAVKALELVSLVANTVNLKSHSPSFWRRDVEAITLIGPCIHYLLSMPRLLPSLGTEPGSEDLVAREMIRLINLILMSRLKEKFSMSATERPNLGTAFAHFVSTNMYLLSKEYYELKIWALVTAAMLQGRYEREIYIQALLKEMEVSHSQLPNEVIQKTRDTLWVNALESPFADDVEEDILHHGAQVEGF